MLSIKNLRVKYGAVEALKGIDIEVRRGEIVCLLGSNGAGKSTALMTISGVVAPVDGEILFDGGSIVGLPPHEILRKGVGHVPEGRRIFPSLSVKENLDMGAYCSKDPEVAVRQVFDIFPLLKDRQRQSGGTLSGGEQQLLAIGRALASNPCMLILDEPSLGLSPIMSRLIFKTIEEINKRGTTVLLVEQNANSALRLAHRGYVLETGRVTLGGSGKELLGDERVRHAYLGEAKDE